MLHWNKEINEDVPAEKDRQFYKYTKRSKMMKKRFVSLGLALTMAVSVLAGCSGSQKSSWKVTCPWAPSGVAAVVSQKVAEMSTKYSDNLTLVAEAVPGDAATVNTWIANNDANSKELVFVGEGLLSITSILDPAKMQFSYDDFTYVENLYSSVFVLSADASLNVKTLVDLENYVKDASEISVS